MGIFDFFKRGKQEDKYSGVLKNGKRNGKGVLDFANGDKYTGDFLDGDMHGKGIFIFENGEKYIGDFKYGFKDGKGTYYYTDGTKNHGEFEFDEYLDGEARQKIYKEQRIEPNRNKYHLNSKDVTLKAGTSIIKNRIPEKKESNKKVKLYHDNGQLRSEATLDANGKPHGNGKEWSPNGKIFKDQNFKHGVPHGSCNAYFENGNIRQEYNFKNGQQHGINNEFYEDGSKNIVANFKDGKEHGLKEQYYASGNLETRTNYVDGLVEGVHIYLKDDGEVVEEKIMQEGLDITMEIMQLMMENEHMIKSGVITDGKQEFGPGELYQKMYEYYKKNNLHVDSHMKPMADLLKEIKTD